MPANADQQGITMNRKRAPTEIPSLTPESSALGADEFHVMVCSCAFWSPDIIQAAVRIRPMNLEEAASSFPIAKTLGDNVGSLSRLSFAQVPGCDPDQPRPK
jgi:hypothetical protein